MSVYDLKSGKELARLATKRKVLHGVVVSPDDVYAFVTVEGVGSEPGTVEIIDLNALKTVATVDVGQQASGIDFLRTERPGRTWVRDFAESCSWILCPASEQERNFRQPLPTWFDRLMAK